MLGFVAVSVLSTRKAILGGLGTTLVAAEERLGVSSKMLAQVTGPGEDRSRRAASMSAAPPLAVWKRQAEVL